MGSLSFTAWTFAAAGAICALGPLIIHLLNRRRYRVLHWAAMDFLREALQRNRRIMQIRDILLLILRTAAVLLFGLALAQPFFTSAQDELSGKQPVHAILVFDNSMSMGYQVELGNTLLDRARERGVAYVDDLPAGSRVTVLPLCGSSHAYSLDAYSTPEQAKEAIGRIEVVDRSANMTRAVADASRAADLQPQLSKRAIIFTDRQSTNWNGFGESDALDALSPIQVVNVVEAADSTTTENTWISDLRIQDGVADVETPATIIVELQHQGPAAREDVQVTLSIDGVPIASKTVSLDPASGAREVAFQHVFNAYHPTPGNPELVPIEASIVNDRLPADDERHLVVHVLAAMPVVFIDQYGDGEESLITQRLGETRHLRKLLAPNGSSTSSRELVSIRHMRIDQLDVTSLSDARLCVIAGLADPGDKVSLLREFVEQGGQLVIAAGAKFDPALWNETAWLDGAGILPLPLEPKNAGATPDETQQLDVKFLSFESMRGHEHFQISGVSDDELAELYSEPFFFKWSVFDDHPETLAELATTERARLEKRAADLLEQHAPKDEEDQPLIEEPINQRWLMWQPSSKQATLEQIVKDNTEDNDESKAAIQNGIDNILIRNHPQVLARFTNETGPVFMAQRTIGQGRVLSVSSGLLSDWNTLPKTNAIVMFDRILRSMLLSTLPRRNYEPVDRLTLPVLAGGSDVQVRLQRPHDKTADEVADSGFIGEQELGVTIPRAFQRGMYRLAAYRIDESNTPDLENPLWKTPISVNGTASESELDRIDPGTVTIPEGKIAWVEPGEEIRLDGVFSQGQDTWWYLILVVFLLLLVEIGILAWPTFQQLTQTNEQPTTEN
jgi:hypothetical protein